VPAHKSLLEPPLRPCELDVETNGDCEEHDGEDTEDDHHGGGCREGARQTLAAVHTVVGVARLTLLPFLRPTSALTRVRVPELIVLHETLASGSVVRASTLTGSVIELLLVAALELLTPAGAAGVNLEAESGADLLQPRLSRHRGLIHDLDTGVGHTLRHTSLIQSIRSVTGASASGELHLIGDNIKNIGVAWKRYLDQSVPGFTLRQLSPYAGLVSRGAAVRGNGGGEV